MNRRAVALAVFVLTTAFFGRASVEVTNGGFELPSVSAGGFSASFTGWVSTGGGGVAAMADKFGGTAGGPLPSPADGRQFAYIAGSYSLYQQVGVIEANRIYRMTVALGRRSDKDSDIAQLALCAGAWNGTEVAMIQGTANAIPGTFREIAFGFDTFGDLAAHAGEALYVRLTHIGANQGIYDNVRVTETSEPAFISNASFEFPSVAAGGYAYVPPGWSVYANTNLGGVTANANLFGGTSGGAMPSPAAGRQAAFVAYGGCLAQEIGVIASNKIYTLTVAAGTRSTGSAGTNAFWLKDGAWDSGTTLSTRTASMPTPGTFADSSISFETGRGVNADTIGHRLVVALGGPLSASTGQCSYDNVRLTVSDPPDPYVANAGFEAPVVSAGGWSNSAAGWTGGGTANGSGVLAMANLFGGTAGHPMPAPAAGRQIAFVAPGAYLYQDLCLIESNRIYTLTVAHGRRSDQGAGSCTISLRDNAWGGPDLAVTPSSAPPAGTFAYRTVSFATTNALHAEAIGHRLFAVLTAYDYQCAFDSVSLFVRRAASVGLSSVPAHTNLATASVLEVTGPLASETDGLTTNAATGSVALSQAVPAPTYVMLWLTGGDAAKYSALAAELSVGGVTALTAADNDWTLLAERYSGFNMLVKFPGLSDTAFNWDFSSGCDWDGTAVDKLAVSTKPVVGTVLILY